MNAADFAKVPPRPVEMESKHLRFGVGFRVALSNERAQVAQMTLEPGGDEGGPDNRHRGADQWLFVVSGEGIAIVEGRRIRLLEGTLLLIERGETHEIRSTGRSHLKTVNFYSPSAYTGDGDELPPGKN